MEKQKPMLTQTFDSVQPEGPSFERMTRELGLKLNWGKILHPW